VSGPAVDGPALSWRLAGAVAGGGALGAAARHLVGLGWPAAPHGFPVATFAVNVSGCLAIGVLLGVHRGPAARAFLGTGVLGGFTTYSAYAVETTALWGDGRPATAVGYAAATLVCALAATRLGIRLVRCRPIRRRPIRRRR
jgi:CrcB protein